MGDFIGFSFNGYHSSDLGIVRVSDGDRYKEDILPDFDDGTVDVPGGDGTYYFGSYYKSKKFTINIAFDHLTEPQYRKLRRIFSTRKPSVLIFDEAPYKAYNVKVEGPPSLEVVCFDEIKRIIGEETDGVRVAKRVSNSAALDTATIEGAVTGAGEDIPIETSIIREKVTPYVYTNEKERVYKGEGEISLIAYDPFARAPYKDLDSYEEYYNNIDEWKDTAGLKTILELLDYDIAQTVVVEGENNKAINVYNPGDMPAPFQVYIPFSNNSIPAFEMILEEKTGNTDTAIEGTALKTNAMIKLIEDATGKAIAADDRDDGVLINTKNHLIEGVKKIEEQTEEGEIVVSYVTTGTLYNDCVESGIFFKINTGTLTDGFDGRIRFSAALTETPEIIYDYIYF